MLSTGALVVIGAAGGILAKNSGSWHSLVGYAIGAVVIAFGVRLLAAAPPTGWTNPSAG